MNTTIVTRRSPRSSFPSFILFLCLVSLNIAGCCRIPAVTSFTDPDFPGPRYGSIVVYAPLDNLEWRQLFERDITQKLLTRGVAAREGSMVIPPTRKWTEEKAAEALKESRADACLRISVMGVTVQEQYVPPKTETTVSKEMTERKQTKKVDTTDVVVTSTTDGYMQRTTTIGIRLELIDLTSGRTAWIATTEMPLDFRRCSSSFALQLIQRMAKEGMIR